MQQASGSKAWKVVSVKNNQVAPGKMDTFSWLWHSRIQERYSLGQTTMGSAYEKIYGNQSHSRLQQIDWTVLSERICKAPETRNVRARSKMTG